MLLSGKLVIWKNEYVYVCHLSGDVSCSEHVGAAVTVASLDASILREA